MKKLRSISTIIVLFIALNSINAQSLSFDFLTSYSNDARLIIGEYMAPYANIIGANLNGGWYNTAKPHKLGGFDITATVSVAFAPDAALQYDLNSLTGLNLKVNGSSIAPTVAGKMEARPELIPTEYVEINGTLQEIELPSITHPDGTGINMLPLPMGQVSLGLFKGTDVTLRYIPRVQMGNFGEIGLFGIGGRHSISQWIPVLKSLKFINISVQGGYTKLSSEAILNMIPDDNIDVPMVNQPSWEDQRMYMNFSGWTLNLIASQSIPIITVYEGIGFASTMADFALLGHYPIKTIVTSGDDIGSTTYIAQVDPIEALEFETTNKLRLNAGIRFKLGILTLHYDFTKTLYATHTAGLGITFR